MKALCSAAESADLPELRRLLAADPGLATAADAESGQTALHHAAGIGKVGVVRLLLEGAPAAAAARDIHGQLPLHRAVSAMRREDAAYLLLEAAPAAAAAGDGGGSGPLHWAAMWGGEEVAPLLLAAAPVAIAPRVRSRRKWKSRRKRESEGEVEESEEASPGCPLEAAPLALTPYLQVARLLLPHTPPEGALAALAAAGDVALPLFADLAACHALSTSQWQCVPAPCPGLRAALPAVLARSEAEAGWLVSRLPAPARTRLRVAALCLARAQRMLGIELERALVRRMLVCVV